MEARKNVLAGRRGFIGTLAGLSLGILVGGPGGAMAAKTKVKDLLQLSVNEDVLYRDEGDGAFLFKPETGNLKYLNSSGKEIFLALKREKKISRVIDHLHTLYPELDPDRLQEDVNSFLKELEENGFISPLDAG